MIFTTASVLLFSVLLLRIAKAPSRREKLFFLLIAALYSLPTALLFFRIEPQEWFETAVLCVVVLGLMFFSFDFFWFAFRRHRESAKRLKDLRRQRGPLYEIIAASRLLSEAGLGALIILERKESLERWCNKGVRVDAKLSREILFSIFSPPGALHDGATLVRKDRVAASGIIVPLTKNPSFPKELGTRHRAAVGISEISDALALIISEETGSVSLADRGYLHYDVPFEELAESLQRAMRFKLSRRKSAPAFEFAAR